MKNIIISNQNLEKIKKEIKKEGKNKIHVLADFDRTLTKTFVNKKKIPSIISILRDGPYISKEYAKSANSLFEIYHPIEMNPLLNPEEKKDKMSEWWSKHFDLLIESGLNKKHIQDILESNEIQFREGALEFLDLLHNYNIPLLIISSSGLGDAIPLLLEKYNRLYDNIHIITNLYEWDKNGKALSVKKPIIHVSNKDEESLRNLPVFKLIKDRKNVILLGDSLDDVKMVHGFDYKNLIKIGFLNEETEKNLDNYKKTFDIIILNDSDMIYVNDLMKEIVK